MPTIFGFRWWGLKEDPVSCSSQNIDTETEGFFCIFLAVQQLNNSLNIIMEDTVNSLVRKAFTDQFSMLMLGFYTYIYIILILFI